MLNVMRTIMLVLQMLSPHLNKHDSAYFFMQFLVLPRSRIATVIARANYSTYAITSGVSALCLCFELIKVIHCFLLYSNMHEK